MADAGGIVVEALGVDEGKAPYLSAATFVLATVALAAAAEEGAGDVGEVALDELAAKWSLPDIFAFGGAPADNGASGTIEYRSGSEPIDGVIAP